MTMPSSPPHVKVTSFIMFCSPDTITINRRPSFGNTFEFRKNRLFDDDNDFIISFRDSHWPKYDVKIYDIVPLTKTQAETIETFLYNHWGQLLDVTINNIVYTGIIEGPVEIVNEKD